MILFGESAALNRIAAIGLVAAGIMWLALAE
jgi:multidrug transporter EmrE-like cation transporter